MAFEQIGLQAIFEDKNFQAGIKRYQDGINTASSATDRGASIMSRLGSVASGALVVGIGAATAALGAFSAVAKIGIDAAMKQGEDLDKLGDMFGMNARQADIFATAMSHFQVPVEEAAYQLNFFTRGLAETTKIAADGKVTLTPFGQSLQKLGVTAYDSRGKLKTLDQIMPQIMDKFAKMPPGVNKSNLAMELFGARGGSKMLDFLSAGSKALTDATKRIDQFGGMTDEQVSALEDFGFSLGDVGENLKKIWAQIGLQVLPILRKFVDFINVRILPAFSQWVREYSPRIIKSLQDFSFVVQRDVLPVISRAWEAVRGFVGAFQKGGIGGFFDELGRQLGNAFKGFDLSKSLGDIGGALSKAIQDNWPKIQAELAKWGGRFWDWLTGKGGALEQAGTQLGKVGAAIMKWVDANGPAVWDLVGKWVSAFWNWITDANGGVIATIATNMGNLAQNIENWTNDPETRKRFQDIGKALARQVIQGIGDLFNNPGEGQNLLVVLWRTLSRAAISLRNAFGNVGQSIARGVIEGIASTFVSPDQAARIGQALSDALRNAANWIIKYGSIPAIMFQIASFAWGEFTNAWTKLFSNWNPFGSSPTPTPTNNNNDSLVTNLINNQHRIGGYANGGPVTHTGLALVHAGEYVIPAPNVNNSRVTNFNFSHNWPAAVPASARGWTEQMVRTVTQQEVRSILDRV